MKKFYSLALSAALAMLSATAYAGDGGGGRQQNTGPQAQKAAKEAISRTFAGFFGGG